MSIPLTFRAYDQTGAPLAGLTPTVTTRRRNADGTYTTLIQRDAVDQSALGAVGFYEAEYEESEVPAGTLLQYRVDLDGGAGTAAVRYLDGEVEGRGVGVGSGLVSAGLRGFLMAVLPGQVRMKAGDTQPTSFVIIDKETGSAIDLTDAGVELFMRDRAGTMEIDAGACTLLEPTGGLLEYPWATGETDDEGSHRVQLRITFDDGKIVTAPSTSEVAVVIEPAIG